MADKPIKLTQMPGYDEELGLKQIQVDCCCNNCQHSDKRRESVIEYLRARGITQVTDAHGAPVPGENTIARDLQWGDMVKRLEDVVLCRIADKSGGPGAELVMKAFCCVRWAEDRGHIVVPANWGKIK